MGECCTRIRRRQGYVAAEHTGWEQKAKRQREGMELVEKAGGSSQSKGIAGAWQRSGWVGNVGAMLKMPMFIAVPGGVVVPERRPLPVGDARGVMKVYMVGTPAWRQAVLRETPARATPSSGEREETAIPQKREERLFAGPTSFIPVHAHPAASAVS